MDRNKQEEITTRIFLCLIGAILISIYLVFSDVQLLRLVNYDVNLASNVGLFTKLIGILAGSIGGLILGLLGYIPKMILMAISNVANDSAGYKFFGFICPILGIMGGANLSVQFILKLMA